MPDPGTASLLPSPSCASSLKLGVIGLGFMGSTHLAAIANRTGAQVAAICSQNRKALDGNFSAAAGNLERPPLRFDFSQVRKYLDWRDLVNDADLQAIDICLPTDLHAEVAAAALRAGKHVLCEKPMALTVPDCERMMIAAQEAGKTLMIGQVLRFWPEYKALKAFVKTGEFGALRQALFVRRCGVPAWSHWLPDESRSGGALLDMLIHDVDQALWLCGMPEHVAAKRLGGGDAVMATLLYPGGPEVRIQGGWFAPGVPFSMSFKVRLEHAELELTPDGLMLSDMSGTRRKVEVEKADAYENEVNYFLDCCRAGVRPEACMPIDSAAAVKVALAMKESRAKDGERITCLV